MSDDDNTKKLLVGVLIAVLGGNAGVIALNKSSPSVRADAFTATDAKEMKEELIGYTDNAFALHRLQIPPRCTREKIESIIDWIERQDVLYKIPCRGW